MTEPEREQPTSGIKFAVIVAALALGLVIMMSGPWNVSHVASNPGPSGTPGSTVKEGTPPPAEGPSGGSMTTGSAR